MRAVRVVLVAALAGPVFVAACGSRTGLLEPTASELSPDAASDVPEEADADVVFPDGPDICPDAGSTLVYVITQSNDLFSFYPPTLTFTRIGPVSCPAAPRTTPFSMAVDRRGIGLSVFSDGTLYQIDMATAACRGTTFQPDQVGFQTFCMGYAANSGDGGDAGETLYVADCDVTLGPMMMKPNSKGLAILDTTLLTLSYVAPFSQGIPGPELTGTGDGRLFGFYTNVIGSGSHIVQIDRGTGTLLQDYPLQVGTPQDGYAFAFWGGVFWVFTSGTLGTFVTRFDPTTGSETNVATMPEGVVGAGVSTCAPM
jgi:hypothetical protein